MPPIYVKPENALKRSEELLALGTPQSQQQAFENLIEVFQSKRFKQTPINVLEPIVTKFIDLCVLLNRKAHAKSGLLVFKSAAQTTNIAAIERVLNHFIAQAETRLADAVEQAKKEVAALPDVPVVDDDLPLQPASLMLDTFVDSAGDRERIERRLIAPAQKYCWDAYDICLDIAKSNDRLEIIYQSIAHRAFKFCKVHERKTDFRRLCEQRLRKDLANAAKYSHQPHAINLSDPETLNRFLETRFLQLQTAVELELWQEAFRSVEDIHGLIAGRKGTKASMMANYYEKLTQIFKAEGGKQTAVFHAAAWARYFQQAERAGIVSDKASGCVLLSALAVPLGEVEVKQRLVALLNLPKMPTRETLVQDAAGKHLKRVPVDIRQIYNILEADFEPTTAAKVLAPLITSLAPAYQPYLPALRDVVLSRLLQALAQVYDAVTLSHILDLVKPLDNTPWATDMPSLEKFLVSACRRGDIRASVDHVSKTITFASAPADPTHLQSLAVCLYNTVNYLNPVPTTSRSDAFAAAIASAEEERKLASHKRQIVIRRRELLEEARLRRETAESTALAERLKAKAEDDARRIKEEAKQAEIDRVRKQINQTKEAEAKQLAASLAAQGALKVDISSIENLDSSKLVAMQVEQLAKEKKGFTERLRIVGKRVDHLERAMRKEEIPLLTDDYERQKAEDRAVHEQANKLLREQAIEQQKAAKELKQRLGRMLDDYNQLKAVVESQMEDELRVAKEEAKKKVEADKARVREQIIQRKREEKARREQEAREEEEREQAEQAAAAQRAEEEARKAAERENAAAEAAVAAEKRKAEREEQRQKDEEIRRKQLEREEESFRRRQEAAAAPPARASYRPPGAGASPSASPAPAAGGGSWLERRKAMAAAGGGSAPSPPPAAVPAAPAPSSSPAPAPASGGSWLERRKAQAAAAAASGGASPSAPTPAPAPAANGADDAKPGVWRRRGAQ
ncbi:eukaryotic translation initiation factor 3 subunit A [Cryptococcus wingfieldii CBS 7118]|uniref:Eukaryotic translation initiation factor 3 subunit A n=1 Tax=Cryptococcus wingfieldii CBS 7118 TaxID=1295528 RepID=A0A1E3IVM4_9TREE|nr:eukaryotic translation initiation factor 3 subunit A [Cryptococcus wingfieldii CBS 7118]ODN92670.1 eukaryotic translation initiation factor 3 subunit A [Cryptococcus wingfieldii CBS 7118]